MVKIKTKKQLNLPQLIEWAWENHIRNKGFESERTSRAYFDYDGYLSCTRAMEPNDLFTVEVEEDITEDTEFEKLYYTTILSRIVESSCTTIQSSLKHIAVEPIAFYILNDDLTMTLIWRDGKLVD